MLEFSVFSVTKLAVFGANTTAKLYKEEDNHYKFEKNTEASGFTTFMQTSELGGALDVLVYLQSVVEQLASQVSQLVRIGCQVGGPP